MPTFQEAISSAVRTQAARKGLKGTDIAQEVGLSRTAYWRHLTNKVPWSSEDFDKLASALRLNSAWELMDLARNEASISDQAVAA